MRSTVGVGGTPERVVVAPGAPGAGGAGKGGPGGPLVTVSKPIVREITEWDEYTARFDATDAVEIRARVSGYLNEVHFKDGQIVATQTAAEVLGNPLVSLAWAANALGRMGRGLHAGDIVLTGSISKVLRPTAGQSVRASFTRLGSVGCRFA